MRTALSRRMAPAPRQKTFTFPAPIGGLDTVSPGGVMGVERCVQLYNMTASDYGLRPRLGSTEHVVNVEYVTSPVVRGMIAFEGPDASYDKLFATTDYGIHDVTTYNSPSAHLAFPSQSSRAGYGVACSMVTSAGHFAFYCDEENGLYLYTSSSSQWTKVVEAAGTAWATSTAYTVGDLRSNGGLTYVVTATTGGGVSASSGSGPSGSTVGTDITDNEVTWRYAPSISGVNPANLVYPCVFQNRVWFVERDTGAAWYLGVNSITGAATRFNMGHKAAHGGYLLGLWSWTVGSDGTADNLVGIFSGGDVVIYRGTDPTDVATFGIVGVWYVGQVPAGREVATTNGGDVAVICRSGVVTLSTLISSGGAPAMNQYQTAPIANLFNRLASSTFQIRGWALRHHPEDGTLLLMIPTESGEPTVQLAMNLTTKGWSQYRDLDICSAVVWQGKLYYGTEDSRVCINTGYLDGLTIADPNSYTAIQWAVLTSFQNLGRPTQKRIQSILPTLMCDGQDAAWSAEARYKYNLSELSDVSAPTAGESTWGSATWDSDVWGGYLQFVTQNYAGASGMGREFAVAIRGASISRTALVSIDVLYDEGGVR